MSSKNWRKVAVGYTEGRVARDGAFVEIPLILADADAVATFDRGTARELSAGYSCKLDWTPGITPQGETYDAKQVGILGNHIALVAAGRAGSECRIGDNASANVDHMDRSRALASARYQDAAYQASKTALNSWRGDSHERVHQSATAVRDALRTARYTGE